MGGRLTTAKIKARARKTRKLAKKKRGLKLARLYRGGKRGVISHELN